MFRTIKLLLPAIIPAWNFFDIIAPSPRIQYLILDSSGAEEGAWSEFRPRPEYVSFMQMLGRMFWNPHWNESLFLMSCAERLIDEWTQHSEDEIFTRMNKEIMCIGNSSLEGKYLKFRVILIRREGKELEQEVVFESAILRWVNPEDKEL